MNTLETLVWFFPILFMFHDFEEIIFMKAWISRNQSYLSRRFPKFAENVMAHFDTVTTASFAAGVAEEFVLISGISVIAYLTGWYYLWIGLFVAFTLHLVMHGFQALAVGGYVPALVTSMICLPVCIWIIVQVIVPLSPVTFIFWSILGLMVLIANLLIIHRAMIHVSKWLAAYADGRGAKRNMP